MKQNFLALPAVLAVACTSMRGTVRDTFTATYTCPREAIQIVPRPDVKAHTITVVRDDPPAEVAADPVRLRLWNERQAKLESDADSDNDVYEASGCGHQERYACHHDDDDNGVWCQDGSLQRAHASLQASEKRLRQSENDLQQARQTMVAHQNELLEQTAQLQQLVDARMQSRLGFSVAQTQGGVTVKAVAPGGRADGKLSVGDTIVSADGLNINQPTDLVLAMRNRGTVSLVVRRNGESADVPIDLP